MVVVTDTILITGRRPRGLDAPDDALLGQDSQRVVDRLSRNGADFVTNILGDFVRRAMRSPRHDLQHRHALSRDLDAVFAKGVGRIVIHSPGS